MIFPWTIHEAEVALYPASKDGWPLAGPAPDREPTAILRYKTNLRIQRSSTPGSPNLMDTTGQAIPGEGRWAIDIDTREGFRQDTLGPLPNRLEPCGFYCLTVRFEDSGRSGKWWLLRFFYVTLADDSTSTPGEDMQRSLKLSASYLQDQSGEGTLPDLHPAPLGEVIWTCGPLRVVALRYDPNTRVWTSSTDNLVSSDPEHPPFVAIGESEGLQFCSYYLPRGTGTPDPAGDPSEAGSPMTITWQHALAFTLGPGDVITPRGGFSLQNNGSAEPLLHSPQSRVFDEPSVSFRYLNRIYASISSNTIAIPSISTDPPPPTHEADFRIGRLRMLPFGSFFPSA